jgi:hypothetical protein
MLGKVDRGRIEQPSKSPENSASCERGGAESGAVGGDSATLADPDLAQIVAAWPTLTDDVKGVIIDLVRDADRGRGLAGRGSDPLESA